MKFLLALCFSLGASLSASALDREAFSIIRYDLNATLDPAQQRLAVRGKITLRNDSDAPQKNIALQISSSLNWISIQLDAKPVEFFSQTYTSDIDHTGALNEAILTPSRPIASKQKIELQIAYEGVIPQDASRLTRIGVPAETAKHSDWDEIGRTFTAVRGIGYVTWYPVATEAASLSDGDSVPASVGRWKLREQDAGMKVNLCTSGTAGVMNDAHTGAPAMSSGATLGQSSMACVQYSFSDLKEAVPIFVVGQFSKIERDDAVIHYLSGHKSGADDYALALNQAAPPVTQWFGDHGAKQNARPELFDLPDPQDAPFESGNFLLMPLSGNDTSLLLSAVRQLAHAAFPSPRLWIAGGLASWAQAAYMQNEKGREAAIAYLQGHRQALIAAEKDNLAQASDTAAAHSLINDPDEFFVETKAMNVWWMLRDMLGETAFTAATHAYRASDDKNAYYMEKLLEAHAHRDLAWFFDDWVYRDRGLPDFHIVSVYPRQLLEGGYMVTVTVENLGAAAAEVPVTLHMTEG
ncbi:MAG TPA: hypothetical protein VGL74_09365, partial [Terriglobales bacterium]